MCHVFCFQLSLNGIMLLPINVPLQYFLYTLFLQMNIHRIVSLKCIVWYIIHAHFKWYEMHHDNLRLDINHIFFALLLGVFLHLTSFTMQSCPAIITSTCVPINLICTGRSIQTCPTGTFIKIYNYLRFSFQSKILFCNCTVE